MPITTTNELKFYVNGKLETLRNPDPHKSIAEYLRLDKKLTGTKISCAEGGCGCCTVLVSSVNPSTGRLDHKSVNACMSPVCQLDGKVLTTVEGLGSAKEGFHPIQRAIADGNGSQCGYCTPGWVMAMFGVLKNNKGAPPPEEVAKALDGNLCRCTGYRPILDSFQSLARQMRGETEAQPPPSFSGVAVSGDKGDDGTPNVACSISVSIPDADQALTSKSDAVLQPGPAGGDSPALALAKERATANLKYEPAVDPAPYTGPGPDGTVYYRPTSVDALRGVVAAELKKSTATPADRYDGSAEIRFINGNTGLGMGKYYAKSPVSSVPVSVVAPGSTSRCLIDLTAIPDLGGYSIEDGALKVGSGLPLQDLIEALDKFAATAQLPATATAAAAKDGASPSALITAVPAQMAANHLRRVATTQVRSVGSWGGNIALWLQQLSNRAEEKHKAMFPSDVALIFSALEATFDLLHLETGQVLNGIPLQGAIDTMVGGASPSSPLANAGYLIVGAQIPMYPPSLRPHAGTGADPPPAVEGREFVCLSMKHTARGRNAHAYIHMAFIGALPPHGSLSDGTQSGGIPALAGCRLWYSGLANGVPGRATEAEQVLVGGCTGTTGSSSGSSTGGLAEALAALRKDLAAFGLTPDLADGAGPMADPYDIVKSSGGGYDYVSYQYQYQVAATSLYKYVLGLRRAAGLSGGSSGGASATCSATGSGGPFDSALVDHLSAEGVGTSTGQTTYFLPPVGAQRFHLGEEDTEATEEAKKAPIPNGALGRPVRKLKARLQASGEAKFVGDEVVPEGCRYGAVVVTMYAGDKVTYAGLDRALVEAILAKKAGVAATGQVCLIEAGDIPGANSAEVKLMGPNAHDEEDERLLLEVGDVVGAEYKPVAMVVAPTEAMAKALAAEMTTRAVKYEVEGVGTVASTDMGVVCLSDESLPPPGEGCQALGTVPHLPGARGGKRHFKRPVPPFLQSVKDPGCDPTAVTPAVTAASGGGTLTGSVVTGAQRHFHMEPYGCLVVPREGQTYEVYATTQGVDLCLRGLCELTGLPATAFQIKAPQLGGSYGAKAKRPLSVIGLAAIATMKLGCPMRVCHANIGHDMVYSGGRERVDYDYELGYDGKGMITGVNLVAHMDCGYHMDDSFFIAHNSIVPADNCYRFGGNFNAACHVYQTHSAPTTWMRAPGELQATFIAEYMLEHLAHALGEDPADVRERNFYKALDKTPSGKSVGDGADNTDQFSYALPTLWAQLRKEGGYDKARGDILAFNAHPANRWRKRGISISPVKYGVNHFLCKALVTISVFEIDGTMTVYHGGCETGQGIDTKVAQAVITELASLGCPLGKIRMMPHTSDIAPNAGITGGTRTSEVHCNAALNAAKILKERLTPFLVEEKEPEQEGGEKVVRRRGWEELIATAGAMGANLCAQGWYHPPNPMAPPGYFTYGACTSEVEVDLLTGELIVLKSDILFDNGVSLNPAIDLGQIQGSFIQGMGYYIMEDCLYGPNGRYLNTGTWNYKVPGAYDLPRIFRVELLRDHPFRKGVLGSKGTGEPPMHLGSTVYFAARQALAAGKADLESRRGLVTVELATATAADADCPTTDSTVTATAVAVEVPSKGGVGGGKVSGGGGGSAGDSFLHLRMPATVQHRMLALGLKPEVDLQLE